MPRKVTLEQWNAMMANSPLKAMSYFIITVFGRVGPKRRTRVRPVRMVA
jgi:hypothetical protein